MENFLPVLHIHKLCSTVTEMHLIYLLLILYLCDAQLGCINGPGTLVSSWMMLRRSVATVSDREPWIEPFHLNSAAVVKLNLWDRWRLLSWSSRCWCLLRARTLVLYWLWYTLYLPSWPSLNKLLICVFNSGSFLKRSEESVGVWNVSNRRKIKLEKQQMHNIMMICLDYY